MKVYQIIFSQYDPDVGGFDTPGRIYSSKEEAEKAKKWLNSIPDDPIDFYPAKVGIKEIEVEEMFTPWISEESIAAKQREIDEYEALLRREETEAQRFAEYEAQMQAEWEAAYEEEQKRNADTNR